MTAPRPSQVRRQILEHALLFTAMILVLLPMLWFVSIAFRPQSQTYQLFPTALTLENFPAMLSRVPRMGHYMLDSIIITAGTVLLVCVTSTMGGYAFTRLRFPGRDIIFWTIVSTLFIPSTAAVASLYLQLFEMNLLDSHLGLILIYTAWHLAMALLIMRGVFSTVPIELEESARLDGASMWHVLWHVYVPLAKGGVVIVALISFVAAWGEYLFAFTFAGTNVVPMSLGIQFFEPRPSDPTYSFNAAVAAALVMFVPSVVIYVIFQKQFSKGVMEGALKG